MSLLLHYNTGTAAGSFWVPVQIRQSVINDSLQAASINKMFNIFYSVYPEISLLQIFLKCCDRIQTVHYIDSRTFLLVHLPH